MGTIPNIQAFVAGEFAQRGRMLSVGFTDTDKASRPPRRSFLAFRLEFSERLSTPFRAVLYGITPQVWTYPDAERPGDRHVEPHPDRFLGLLTSISVRAESRTRKIHGVVTAARQIGNWHSQTEDIGYDVYELVVEPTLCLLALRQANRVFQERTTLQILHELLDEHRLHNPLVDATLRATFPVQRDTDRSLARAYRMQYQESDLDFIQRLLIDEGLNYVLEAETGHVGTGNAWHVFAADHRFDDTPEATLSVTPRPGNLPLTGWMARRQLVPAFTRALSHDYKDNTRYEARHDGRANLGMGEIARGKFGHYETLSPRAVVKPSNGMGVPAQHRQWARDMDAEIFVGTTTVPLSLASAVRIKGLESRRHPMRHGESRSRKNDYIVTAQTIVAHVTLPGDVRIHWATLNDEIRQQTGTTLFAAVTNAPPLHVTFEAQPADKPLVPPHPSRALRPRPGPMTATVVGPPDTVVATDDLGRVAVVFHWERAPDVPQFACNFPDFPRGPPIRVRYVHPGAGEGMGFQYLPRVGDEVLILFIDNDPDRPVAVGSVHNGRKGTPGFGGVSTLPGDAALTGLRSVEHNGRGANELVLDDTNGEVGLRLATSTAHSELNLGHLAVPRKDGKAAVRGLGAELRTEGAAVFRAAQGMLVSTENAAREAHHLRHDDLAELLARCQDLTQALGRAMARAGGDEPRHLGQTATREALATWASSPTSTGDKGTSALLAFHGKDGILAATEKSQVLYAGEHLDLTADGTCHLASGQRTHVNAGQGVGIHTCEGGIAMVASAGRVSVEAAQHDLRIDARQSVTVTSHDDEVVLSGRIIRLVADDGSYIRLGEGVEVGSPDKCRMYVTDIEYAGSRSMTRDVRARAAEDTRQRAQLVFPELDPTEIVAATKRTYAADQEAQERVYGETDDEGMTGWVSSDSVRPVRFLTGTRVPEPGPTMIPNEDTGGDA
ncbi:type VI secretion system Vgr family protein [Luteibacter sp. 22Crub2.1]|uniref:type VI secretion system Vgr family protein n=1 Tax=Luteibacter sp. 22Crub2.1 TaxID=1283288 RepID=UPI0009A7B596|nr:type VI secretion system Vgr family protein [Luteibacter sp. 22Crub2.1]SKB78221.1 type VI secretion system secreted protein VgrG [Luteibacter sp. 22Crub2.1]